MNNLFKICIHHGDLLPHQIYLRPDGQKICRICKIERHRANKYLPDNKIGDDKYRRCSHCKEIKELNEFQKHDKKLKYPYCSVCRNKKGTTAYHRLKSHLKRKYGMSADEYNLKLQQQNNLCAICHKPETSRSGNQIKQGSRLLSVDHDHTTGKNRDLLCNRCNHVLGSSLEDISILQSAIDYLIKHKND